MIRASLSLLLVSAGTVGCGARTALPDGSSTPAEAGVPSDATVSQDTNPPIDASDCEQFAPSEPIVIAAIDEPFTVPVALRVIAPYVYFGFFITSGEQNGSGLIYRVPVVGGEVERVEEEHYNYGPIHHDGTYLYFPQSVHVDSSGYHPAIMARTLADGTTFPLSNPVSSGGLITVSDLFAGPDDGVFWLVHPDEGGTVLAFWDGKQSAVISELSAFAYALAVTNSQAFMQSNKVLYAAPRAGGEPVVIRPLDPGAALLGVSNESLFYTPEGSSIVRRDSAGQETTILEGAALATRPYSGQVPAWVDEAWLSYAQANALLRVPSVGGSLEVLVESTGIVEAISGDACNLYWLETSSSGPAALMVRAIEP